MVSSGISICMDTMMALSIMNECNHDICRFGLLSNKEEAAHRGTYLDALCASMEQRMQFGPNERDLVILQHEFGIVWADGAKVCDILLLGHCPPNICLCY